MHRNAKQVYHTSEEAAFNFLLRIVGLSFVSSVVSLFIVWMNHVNENDYYTRPSAQAIRVFGLTAKWSLTVFIICGLLVAWMVFVAYLKDKKLEEERKVNTEQWKNKLYS